MKKFRKIMFVLLFALTALFLTNCDKTDYDQEDVDNATVTLTSNITFENSGDRLNSVTGNINLPEKEGDVTITWTSENPSVISNTGIVVRPDGDDVQVKLTATLTLNKASETRTIEFTVKAKEIITWSVTFDVEGNKNLIDSLVVEDGEKATEPTAPEKELYEFEGWYVGDDKFSFDTPITADVDLVAKFERSHYIITFNYDYEDVSEEEAVKIGENIPEPEDVERQYYEFIGWYKVGSDDVFDFEEEVVEGEITLIAQWKRTNYFVYFDLDYDAEEEIEMQAPEIEGGKATEPDEPERDRFEFLGWYEEDRKTKFNFNKVIVQDVTAIALWKQLEVVVEFDLGYDADAPAKQKFPVKQKATQPQAPERDRFEFLGWYSEGIRFNFSENVEQDYLLVARWKQIEATVSFDINYEDGTSPASQDLDLLEKNKADEPNEPTRDEYRFLGWYDGDNRFDFEINIVDSDLLLVARWAKDVVVDANDVVVVAPEILTHYIKSAQDPYYSFNPFYEVYAYNRVTDEPLDVIIIDQYFELWPGNDYHIEYQVVQSPDVTVTVNYVVKELEGSIEIPNELSTEPIEIVFWHSNGSVIENALKGYASDFERMMRAEGYNITVKIEKPASTYDDLRETFINAIKGAKLPNLIQNYPDHVVEYDKNNVILPLTPYIFHPVHGMGSRPNESINDILEAYRYENRSNNLIGDFLSLPFNKSTEIVSYNKTYFDAVLRGRTMPTTWQDLFALTDDIIAIKDNQIDAIVARWRAAGKPLATSVINEAKEKFVPFTYDSSANAFITLTRQFGGEYTSRDPVTGKGNVEFINPNTLEMLNYFASDRGRTFTVPKYWGVDYANSVSFNGTTIFSVGSTGGARYNTPVQEGFELYEIGIMPVPYDKYNPSSRTVIQQGTNISLTNSGTAQQQLASWLFLKYITSTDVQADFGIKTGYSPVRNSSYETAAYKEYLAGADIKMPRSYQEAGMSKSAYTEAYENKVKAMASKAAAEQRQYAFFDYAFLGSSKAREEVGLAFDRIMLYPGSDLAKEINDALEAAKAETERVIK